MDTTSRTYSMSASLGVREFHSGSALRAKDYYSILGVDKSASTKDIKKVHNDLCTQYPCIKI